MTGEEHRSVTYTLNEGDPEMIVSGGDIQVFPGTMWSSPQRLTSTSWSCTGINDVLEDTRVTTQTFGDIDKDLVVQVVFGAQTCSTVHYATGGDNGTISATTDGIPFDSGDNSIGNGTRVEFIAVPATGHMVEQWTVNADVVITDVG